MKNLMIFNEAGEFAENKDVARRLRLDVIIPALDAGEKVQLDFNQVSGATQSFVHALISDLFRNYGVAVMERLEFKNCSATVQKIIVIVCDYMQEASES
jgi:hypothetical protein